MAARADRPGARAEPERAALVAPATSAAPGAAAVLALQHDAGNRAVSQLVLARKVRMYQSADDARKAAKKEAFAGTETKLKAKDLKTAFATVQADMATAGIAYTPAEAKKMKAKLEEWIEKDDRMRPSDAWMRAHLTFGESLNTGRVQDKRFGSYLALGKALLGQVRSRPAKKTESRLAAKTRDSSYIKGKLREVQQAIHDAIEAITDPVVKAAVWDGMQGRNGARKGEYFHWYGDVGDIEKMLRKGTGSFAEAITSIHDAGTVMLNNIGFAKANVPKGVIDPHATGADFQGTVETPAGNGAVTANRVNITIGYRANSTTVNEENPWVETARAHGALLWAGPSHTTANMMKLLRGLQAGGAAIDASHFEAVAWAIFAFWNKDFYTYKDGYHTFHEVMDVASGYGVPYTPFSYPTRPPPYPVATAVVADDTGESAEEEL